MAVRRRIGGLAAVAALAVAGCTVQGAASDGTSPPPAPGEELDATGVLEAVGPSVALVSTPAGTGSAVVLGEGYLITNAHVVDPFVEVELTFEGEEPIAGVEVVGVDLDADLALLGPIDAEHPVAELSAEDPPERGAEVFLVGFPGDQREPEVTVAGGVVSRHRSAEGWGLDFLQSDTTIGAGQSGGALVDDRGRVVGISGLGDDDGFAYSLVAADVAERLDDLHDGGDDAWEPAPTVGGSTSFEVEPTGGEPAFLYLPYVAEDVDLTIEAPPGAALAIADPGWSTFPWAVDQEGAEMDGDDAYWSLDDAEEIDQDASGAWTVEVLAGLDAIVMVGDPDADGALAVTSSIPLIEIELPYVEADLELGETVTGVVNHLDDSVVYLVDLEAGVPVEVAARSAVGDMGWDLLPLEDTGDTLDEFYADDGGGGLFDLDAVEEITPTVDGPHLLVIYTWDGIATAFEASVTEV